MEQTEQIQQLVQSVQQLTEALTVERRERVVARRHLRLGMAGLAASLLTALWLVWPGIPANANLSGDIKQLEMDFKEINQLLANLNPLVTQLNQMLTLAGTSMQTPGGVLNDVGILVTRFKQDSDVMRKYILSSSPAGHPALNYQPKAGQLDSEQASPIILASTAGGAIRDEIRFLNQHIMELTYYIRSTVGRAGTWMNWMPTAP